MIFCGNYKNEYMFYFNILIALVPGAHLLSVLVQNSKQRNQGC